MPVRRPLVDQSSCLIPSATLTAFITFTCNYIDDQGFLPRSSWSSTIFLRGCVILLSWPVTLNQTRRHPVEQKPHAHYDEFAEQFTCVLHEHWSDILQVVNRQSPRIAALLRVATPSGLQRKNGVWRIHVMTKRVVQRDKLHQPRDNEIVAQGIRSYFQQAAELKLPRVTVEFEL